MLPASATPSRCNIGFGFLKSAMKNQPTPYLLKHSVQHWNCLLQTTHSQLKLQQLHRQFCNICDIELEKLCLASLPLGMFYKAKSPFLLLETMDMAHRERRS